MEAFIAEHAPKGTATREQLRFIRQEALNARRHDPKFRRQVKAVLDGWGDALYEAALLILTGSRKSGADTETKEFEVDIEIEEGQQFPLFPDMTIEDLLPDDLRDLGKVLLAAVPSAAVREHLMEVGGQGYLAIAHDTFDNAETTMGLAIVTRDELAEHVLAAGGRRLGLVDLDRKTHARLFNTLTELQEQGADWQQVARTIRDKIPAGPWKTSAIRAKVIARTELSHAQRVSQLSMYDTIDGLNKIMVFDNRIGHNDAICAALDQKIVTMEQAKALMDTEHPNGTRSFTPYYGDLEPV